MKKADLQIIIKILVSIIFLFLLFIKIDIQNSLKVLNNCHKPLAFTALIITISTAFLLALRLFILIKKQIGSEKVNYFNIFKLTMVGIFFNNFLPTGAGGDIAKAFFLVKEEQNKLLVGSSVLIDRFLGALTVIFMGTVSAWLTPELPTKYKVFLLSILLLLFSFILLFTNRNIANFFKFLLKNRLPVNLKNKLQTIYLVFSSYFLAKKSIALAILISIITQTISIIGNYLMGVSLVGSPINLKIFFTYIPLIWTSTMIPSLGGLGVREFTYVYFFSNYLGKENSGALSILILLGILIQSIIGGIILLFLRAPQKNR